MRKICLLSLLLISPTLCGTDISYPVCVASNDSTEPRQSLEEYVHQLEGIVDLQLEELAAALQTDELKSLRKAHYEWKLVRDIECARVRLESEYGLAELECLAQRTEEYFVAREAEIATLIDELPQ